MWSSGNYIGSLEDRITSDVIKKCVGNQRNTEEKEAYEQMKIQVWCRLSFMVQVCYGLLFMVITFAVVPVVHCQYR